VNKATTTFELVDEYFRLCQDKEYIEEYNNKNPDDPIDNSQLDEVSNQLAVVEENMVQKIENIEYVLLRKDEALAIIDASIDTYNKHLKRLKTKRKSISNGWDRLQGLIKKMVNTIGMENKSGNRQLKTDTITYTVYHSPGKLEITDNDSIPSNFQEVQVKTDMARLRKHVIKEGGETEYATVPNEERLRIR